jgi:hypothetical protein
MTRQLISQWCKIVAPALCCVMVVGGSGCTSRPRVGQPVPTGAIVGAETDADASDKTMRYTSFAVQSESMLYVYDATADILVFSGKINADDVVRLYPGTITVMSPAEAASNGTYGTEPVGRVLAGCHPGHTIRAYYQPLSVRIPSADGTPATLPFR